MPQDIPQEEQESEQTTQRAGGRISSVDSDNAGAEISVMAAEIDAGSQEIQLSLERDIEELEQELQELQAELEEAREARDFEAYQQIENDIYDTQADLVISRAEHTALTEFGYLGTFSDRIHVPSSNGSNGRNRYIAAINGEYVFRRHAEDTPIADFIVGELLTMPVAPLKAVKWLSRANNAARAARMSRAARLLERLREARRGLGRARTGRGERVNGRRRRRNRRCRRRGGNPVFVDNGVVQQLDPSFVVNGLFETTVSSTYQSDIDHRGPLGWNRVSDIEATIERLTNSDLRYRDGSGFHIDFNRPTPNPGQWNPGDHIRHMEIAAGKNRSFLVREEGLIRHFDKYPDGIWRLSHIENQNGAQLLFERDEQGLLLAIDTPEGLRLEFQNDAQRSLRLGVDLISQDGSRKQVMRYAYDDQDNLILAECPFGDKHEYRYDDRHLRVWARINDQYEAKYHFDDLGRCVLEETNGPYDGTRFEYDPERRITKHIPGGDKSKTEILYYEEDGAVFMEAHISGRVKQTYYDEEGYTAAEQDGNGNRTKFKYDPWGNINSIEDPEGRISDFRWTEDGQMEFAIDPSGATWESDYDEFGNLIATKDANGFDTEIRNNEMGQPTAICRHDGLIRFLSYSDNGWLTSEIDFDGMETTYERDAFGRVTSITEADERKTEYSYPDQEGWDFWTPSKVVLQAKVTLETKVVKPRRHLIQTDGSGRTTSFLVDGFGKIEATQDSRGSVLQFRYDKAEELAEVENQTGQTWTFERDDIGRIVRETDFGGRTIIYEYDAADRLTASIYPDGTRHEIEMDKSGLMTKETVTAPGQQPLVTDYQYDERALLKSARNADGLVEFERDANGQVTAEIINGTRIESTYDCCGRRETRTIGVETVNYGYDPVGRLAQLTIGDHAPLKILRDKLGHETVRSSSAGFNLQQKFGTLGLLAEQRFDPTAAFGQPDAPVSPILERRYLWNKSFEPVSISDRRWGETTYDYDPNGQITRTKFGDGSEERFSYDTRLNIDATGFGNPEAQQFAARLEGWMSGADGRVERAHGPLGEVIFLTYDAKGRVIEKRVEQNGFRPQVWRFEWNGLDRMIAAHTPEGAKWTYGYDAFARRLWKQEWVRGVEDRDGVEAIVWSEGRRHDFLWDGDVLASETVDGVRTDWHFEPESFVPVAKCAGGALSYVVTDHLGTPREVVSEAGGLEWSAQYRTWGELKRVVGGENFAEPEDCPIRFQGQWEDAETGLFYNRFRYYAPGVGYVSSDPVGLIGGNRLFAYVSSPSGDVDPSGLNAALRKALGMRTGNGMQAHHIIPKELWKQTEFGNFFNDIGMPSGSWRDHRSNGIGLPNNQRASRRMGLPWHCGSHPVYTQGVRELLNPIRDDFRNGNISAAEARRQVNAVQQNLRQGIRAMPGGIRIF